MFLYSTVSTLNPDNEWVIAESVKSNSYNQSTMANMCKTIILLETEDIIAMLESYWQLSFLDQELFTRFIGFRISSIAEKEHMPLWEIKESQSLR